LRPRTLDGHQFRLDRRRDFLGDVVLQLEDIGELAIVMLGPVVGAAHRVDKFGRDPQAIARLSHASFQDVAYAEFASDLLYVDGPPLVNEARMTRDDQEPPQPRKGGDDVLGNAIAEVVLLGIAAQVQKGQHRDRRLLLRRRVTPVCADGPLHCRRGAVRLPRWARPRRPDLVDQGLRLGAGLDLKLVPQKLCAGLILFDREAGLALLRVVPHQGTMRSLLQRIELQQTLCRFHPRLVGAVA